MMSFFDENLLKSLGIIDWGYTEEIKAHSFNHYEQWAESDHSGSLHYLQDHRKDLRKDLTCVQEGAQSAFVFLFDYHGARLGLEELKSQPGYNNLKLASYTVGFDNADYHVDLNERLKKLGELLKEHHGADYTVCLDTKPVLERDLAYRAGLGWFGKNSMLISKNHGSFFLIGSLVANKTFDIQKKEAEVDHCGKCRACVEACPTQAIDEKSRTLIANQCISTFTIEMFKETAQIPSGFDFKQTEIFGCDICQDVCPWNERPVRLNNVSALDVSQQDGVKFYLMRPLDKIIDELSSWSNGYFKRFFVQTVFERTGRVGLLKNLKRLISDE
jgi:epoxyqueuosine reductase